MLADRADANSEEFHDFKRQLYHTSLSRVLSTLRPGMTAPKIVQWSDDHFRRALYNLAPHISDYPEQVLAMCVVTGWCAT